MTVPEHLTMETGTIAALWAVAATGVTWYITTMGRQITYVTLSDGRRKERSLPLIFRALLPLAPTFGNLFDRPAFAKDRERAGRGIVSGGYEGLLHAAEFLALRFLMPLTVGALLCMLIVGLAATGRSEFLTQARIPLCVMISLYFYIYPNLWLRRVIGARHRSIRRSLPFVLDILTLSVEAGMDFMTALQRHVERPELDALGEELLRVTREIQVGKTRREALRAMSWRVNFLDVRTVINALCQADELGVSIGSILRIQADQIRSRRFERAEQMANIAPVKMLFPLLFFIFPAVFLILLGPVVRQIMQSGF